MTEKTQLRQEAKQRLDQLTEQECAGRGEAFLKRIAEMPEYQAAKVIFCYLSVEKEPATQLIVEDALKKGKTVCAPVCIRRGEMRARKLSSIETVVLGAYEIPMPPENEPWIEPSEIEFGVIPCVACGKDCTRIGHGAGFYDRFMESGAFFRAALCHSEVCYDSVPTQPHDLPMDAVITEIAVYRKGDF